MPYNLFPSYNTYSAYPNNSYQQQYAQAIQPAQYMQQNGASYAAQQQPVGIVWVDGEVGAKAFQLPVGWPANVPMPLWDTNDTVIYLKSINQMGMPNPLQRVRYTIEKQPRMSAAMSSQSMLPSGEAGQQNQAMPDMSEYVRKDEVERMIKDAVKNAEQDKGARTNGKSAV